MTKKSKKKKHKKKKHAEKTAEVVIVGAGFAGIGCAKELAKRHDVHVTLIDKHNYHQFLPLLYQVATYQLSPTDVAMDLRQEFRKHKRVSVKLRASQKSTLKVGAWGDVTFLDPDLRWTFDASRSKSKSRNTPFDNYTFQGAAVATIVSGRVVYTRQKLAAFTG